MYNVIEETRQKLSGFIDNAGMQEYLLQPQRAVYHEPEYEGITPSPSRIIRKIPKRNYSMLGKYVPISWL